MEETFLFDATIANASNSLLMNVLYWAITGIMDGPTNVVMTINWSD